MAPMSFLGVASASDAKLFAEDASIADGSEVVVDVGAELNSCCARLCVVNTANPVPAGGSEKNERDLMVPGVELFAGGAISRYMGVTDGMDGRCSFLEVASIVWEI